MAIQTTLQPKYLIRVFAVTVICLVFGVWGLYDYYVKIPTQQRLYERGRVYEAVNGALEAQPFGSEDALAEIRTAAALLKEELEEVDAALGEAMGVTPQSPQRPTLEEIRVELKSQQLEQWFAELLIFRAALAETAQRTASSTPSEFLVQVIDHVRQRVSETASISPPGAFDRAVQWAFILCLPCVPYFVWTWLRARGRAYRLDDDGTLHTPAGAWPVGEIADIDMSRWMAKSTAEVVHVDGRRVKLDDYVYRRMHEIVGALASRLHHDAWDEQARPRKKDAPAAGDGEAA